MRCYLTGFALMLALSAGFITCAEARTMTGTAHVVIMDADTMQPVEGASVAFLSTDKSWPLPPGEAEKIKLFSSDAAGAVKGKAPVGRSTTTWAPFMGTKTKEKWAAGLLLHVEKEGYKPFTALTTWAEQTVWPPYVDVYLGNVLLAKADSGKASEISEEAVRVARAEVSPPYGSAGQSFQITIEFAYPKSLEAILREDPGKYFGGEVSSPYLWDGRVRLDYVEPKPGDPPRGFTYSGQVTTKAGAKPGAYPVDVRVLLRRAEPLPIPGAARITIGSTEEEAKTIYEKETTNP